MRSAWTAPEWYQHVASPAAFLAHYMPVEQSPQFIAEVLLLHFLHTLCTHASRRSAWLAALTTHVLDLFCQPNR